MSTTARIVLENNIGSTVDCDAIVLILHNAILNRDVVCRNIKSLVRSRVNHVKGP